MLVGRLDRTNEDTKAVIGADPALPLVGIRPDGEIGIGTRQLHLARLDAQPSVQRDHAGLVRKQRVDVELLDRRAIDHELRQPPQRLGDRREVGGRPVAIAFEQLVDAGLLHEIARQLVIQRRQRHRRIVDDLGCRASRSEQDHRAEQGILVDAEQEFVRVGPRDHGLHGEAFDARLGLQLAHPLQHLLGGADRLLRRAQSEAHAADIGFMRDVLGEDLDRQSRRLLQQAGGDGVHLLRRSRHAGGDRRDAVGGETALASGSVSIERPAAAALRMTVRAASSATCVGSVSLAGFAASLPAPLCAATDRESP